MVGGLNSYYRQGGRNYDVGLHAITNYARKGVKTGPLARLLRHLRLKWEELALVPQIIAPRQKKHRAVAFPGVSLNFSNDIELLESEIVRKFPESGIMVKKGSETLNLVVGRILRAITGLVDVSHAAL